MSKDKISVALCTYNGASFIQAQLDSILNQTRVPDEIIICDDNSSDSTVEIVTTIANQYPALVRLIRNRERLGLHRNFSQAIECATGNIIFLSDQDDIWLPDRIIIMLRPFLADLTVGSVYSNATIVNARLQPTGCSFFDFVDLARIDNPGTSAVIRWGGGIPGCLLAIRATLKPFILPVSLEWNYDHYIAFIAYALTKVVRIDESLMYYRRHGNNVSNDDIFGASWLVELRAAQDASSLDFYTKERLQWEIMLQHLEAIAAEPAFQNSIQLGQYLIECRLRVEFAVTRETFRQRTLLFRLVPALKSLCGRQYHRYMRGLKTFGKDLLLG